MGELGVERKCPSFSFAYNFVLLIFFPKCGGNCMRDRSRGSREDCCNHEANTLLLLVGYGLQMLKPMNRNCETSAPLFPDSGSLWVSRCQPPLETWASRCAKPRSHGKRPLPWAMQLVPLAPRILLVPTICQSSCQVRENWMRDMSLPQWLLRKFQVAQGLLGMWTCLTLGKMAAAWTEVEHTL